MAKRIKVPTNKVQVLKNKIIKGVDGKIYKGGSIIEKSNCLKSDYKNAKDVFEYRVKEIKQEEANDEKSIPSG